MTYKTAGNLSVYPKNSEESIFKMAKVLNIENLEDFIVM